MPNLEIEGGTLHYLHEGAGIPVIFVSGLGGTAEFWTAQVQAFRGRYRVVTFDHRGVGGSSGAPPYSVDQWSDDLLRLADGLRCAQFHLVGHSTGGVIAQHFASRNPGRVRSLVLGGTWLSPDRRFRELFALRKDVLVTLGEDAYRTLGDLLSSSQAWDEEPSVPPSNTPREIAVERIDALLAYCGEANTARIVARTLVVASIDDHIVPAYLSRRLADTIVGSRMLLLHHGGHFFPRTCAGSYNEALSEFWAEASDQ